MNMGADFRKAVETKDLDAMRACLAPDVEFHSPVAFKPYHSREIVSALLGAGLVSGDLELLALGLDDRIHQPRRASLYPESWGLLGRARELGALGATISGSGSAVLVWVEESAKAEVEDRLIAEVADWAEVLSVKFESVGATVDGVAVA